MTHFSRAVLAAALITFVVVARADAQAAPLGIPDSRMGSGTAWVPDESSMRAVHTTLGSWSLMTHGVAFLQYDRQLGIRGGEQFGSLNWLMVGGTRPAFGGRFGLRGMMSLEPFTIAKKGYPLLLQTGERWGQFPLVDYQHPHDLFMELVATYERLISDSIGISLYAGPVGEPSAGPSYYGHRPSADGDPFAPLAHHWQDAAHIQYSVATVGLFSRRWRIEASAFAGDNSDETRTDFDCVGKCFDSWSVRASWNPAPRWSAQVSYAHITEHRHIDPGAPQAPASIVAGEENRATAAVLYSRALDGGGSFAASAIVGANRDVFTNESLGSALVEGSLSLSGGNSFFARAEWVQKDPYDLRTYVVCADQRSSDCAEQQPVPVTSLVAGYLRTLGSARGIELGVGGRAAINFVPKVVEWAYGTTMPKGFAVYLRLRPAPPADAHAGHRM